jgi:hypothetical protein
MDIMGTYSPFTVTVTVTITVTVMDSSLEIVDAQKHMKAVPFKVILQSETTLRRTGNL